MSPRNVVRVTALIVITLLLIAGVSVFAWPFVVDDAWIVAGYARSLLEGYGYSLDGTRVSDGVTGPLWLAPFLLAGVMGVAPMTCAKVFGLACTLIAVGLVLRRLSQRQGSRGLVIAAACAIAVQSDLAIWSIAGLETAAATLALTVAALCASASRFQVRHARGLGVAVALLAWLRPELALASAVLLACAWWRDRAAARWSLGLAMLGALSVVVFRGSMFGHVLPLSFSAKPAELGKGAFYVMLGLLLITGGVGVIAFGQGMRVGRATDRWIGGAVIAHVMAVLLAGGDWMPGFRLLVPIIPLYAWVAALSVVRATRLVGCTLLVVMCALPLLNSVVQAPRARASGQSTADGTHQLALWLRQHARHVALVDVGYVPYVARVAVTDLAGVTDTAIASLPGGHVAKRIPIVWLAQRNPDTLVLRARDWPSDRSASLSPEHGWHSITERDLARSAFVRSRYRLRHVVQHAERYVYYVLQRADADTDAPQ